MQTLLMQNEAGRPGAVTRTRSLTACATSPVSASTTRVSSAAPITGGDFGTRGVTASANELAEFAGTFGTATAWSLYIAKPMPKVNFHDRWPLGSTP